MSQHFYTYTDIVLFATSENHLSGNKKTILSADTTFGLPSFLVPFYLSRAVVSTKQ